MKLAYAFLAVGLLLAMPASAATDDASPAQGNSENAIFAGCFWCVDADLDKVPGRSPGSTCPPVGNHN